MKKTMVGPESRYAKALFDLAVETNLDEISASMKALSGMFESSKELSELVVGNAASEAGKRSVLLSILSEIKAPKEVENFINLLADKGRLNVLPGVFVEFEKLLEAHSNVVRAAVTSAAPLTDAQREDVFAFVEKNVANASEIVLDEYVDESLMAGVQVRVGDMQYDASVKGKLNGMRQALLS